MKRVTIVFISLLLVFVTIASVLKTEKQIAFSSQRLAIGCYPGIITIPSQTAVLFSQNPDLRVAKERKNVYSLLPAEKDSLRVAFARMKANTNINDKRSWIYQTSIHGTLAPQTMTLWNSAEYAHSPAGNSYQFFLSWHRMYLYFFEKILLSYQNDPHLRLPYWDPSEIPQNDTRFPTLYRVSRYDSFYKKRTNPNIGQRIFKTVDNPLYNVTRRTNPYPVRTANPNDGDEYDTYVDACGSANNKTSYCTFLSSIEGMPHNNIHGIVGGANGDMKNLKKAANDPAFFLHHVNIDRLWEKWIKRGYKNPGSGDFTAQYFYFFDEQNTLNKLTGLNIVDTKNKLKYFFSGINNSNNPSLSGGPDCCPQNITQSRLLRTETAQPISNNTSTISLTNFSFSNMTALLALFKSIHNNQRLIIELEDVIVNKFPDGVINVFFAKEGIPASNITKASFVGSLNLVNTTMKHNLTEKSNLRLDITEVFKKMNLSLNTIKKTKLVFKNSYPGTTHVPSISFQAINLILETSN